VVVVVVVVVLVVVAGGRVVVTGGRVVVAGGRVVVVVFGLVVVVVGNLGGLGTRNAVAPVDVVARTIAVPAIVVDSSRRPRRIPVLSASGTENLEAAARDRPPTMTPDAAAARLDPEPVER
jgi:hypothetical protein